MKKVSGRIRYRRGWFGRVILEVEEWTLVDTVPNPQGSEPFLVWHGSWRDGRMTDLEDLKIDNAQ